MLLRHILFTIEFNELASGRSQAVIEVQSSVSAHMLNLLVETPVGMQLRILYKSSKQHIIFPLALWASSSRGGSK